MSADLHIHTNYSDSDINVSRVIEYAEKVGLSHISITDHDILDSIFEAEKIDTHIEIIPGVEIGCCGKNKIEEIHILGYFIDPEHQELKKFLSPIREGREWRIEKIVKKLKEKGMDINLSDVRKISGGGAIGRLHVAKTMFEKGMGDSVLSCFSNYLTHGKPGWVERESLPGPDEAIEVIRRVGGVSVLAHPYDTIGLLPGLVKVGLVGIEAIHPKIDKSLYKYIIRKARDYNLIVTGGSDSHGTMKGEDILIGKYIMDDEMVDTFIKNSSLRLIASSL
ncbi:TPA: phosphatase [bacterium]|nr:phosphatase [bacterium]